jgi:hypothetical protein
MPRARQVVTLCLAAGAALGGCVVGGTRFTAPDPVPADKAAIYFYRPGELHGAAVAVEIEEPGQPAVAVKNGQFVRVLVAPGSHSYRIEPAGNDQGVSFGVEAGQTYYVRVAIKGADTNTLYLSRVYPDEATVELKTCCKAGDELTEEMTR